MDGWMDGLAVLSHSSIHDCAKGNQMLNAAVLAEQLH